VITALIERADGDVHAVLDLLHKMTAFVEAHIANQATPISSSRREDDADLRGRPAAGDLQASKALNRINKPVLRRPDRLD
jgi:hypothetical protein